MAKAIALLALLGLIAWVAVWNTTPQARAGYDTLWYARFAYIYSGASEDAANDMAWELVTRYGDQAFLSYMEERDGWPWQGFDDPSRERWVGIYQMRPIMPLVSAAAYPLLGIDAPLAASALAVVVLVIAAGVALAPVAGSMTALVVVLLSLINPHASGWLVHLTTDGLGMALWFAVLAASAPFVTGGGRHWLLAVAGAALLLAFTRQTATIVPLTFGLATVVAVIGRATVWRRFAALTAATVPALIIFAVFSRVANFPSFGDMLQDVPTTHFSRPDVYDPIGFIVDANLRLLPAIVDTFFRHPVLPLIVGLGIAGFLIRPRWWALPWAIAVATIPLLHVAHPIITGLPRTVAPAWFSLNLGIGLLVAAAVDLWRRRRVKGTDGPI